MNPFVSICIPAYKRISYLKRLLESIIIQTYKDYEVIITDDSDNDSVKDLLKQKLRTGFPFDIIKMNMPSALRKLESCNIKGKWTMDKTNA